MNEKNFIRMMNEYLQKLDRDSRRHVNCLRFGLNETKEHALGKLNEIMKARKADTDLKFLTEVYSADRKFRADLIIFWKGACPPEVIEIAVNETKESIDKKAKFWMEQKFNFSKAFL